MPKAKLSVTVDKPLLERAMRIGGKRSRSEIIESALAEWVRTRRRASIEGEVERYYSELDAEERAEDERWARHGDAPLRGH